MDETAGRRPVMKWQPRKGKTLVLYSGGLDSTVLLYDFKRQGREMEAISFNYGQHHARELRYAMDICANLGIRRTVIELPPIPGSLLTDGSGSDVVPNRNAIMLHVAASVASAQGMTRLAYGANLDDGVLFRDCQEFFVRITSQALTAAGLYIDIDAPFINTPKWQIIALGAELGVPFDKTWSCYNGGDQPCGDCHACISRRQAHEMAQYHKERGTRVDRS